jgi:hypothetical protein
MPVFRFSFAICLILGLLVACQGSSPAPQANAGQDFSVMVGTPPTFDGCASSGDIVNYRWTIVDAPDQKAEDIDKVIRDESVECLFSLETLMEIEEVGDWEVELEVRDSGGRTDTDTVIVSIIQ